MESFADISLRLMNEYSNYYNLSEKHKDLKFVPRICTYQNNESYFILVELTGISKEDVSVDIYGNMVSIKGERKKFSPTFETNEFSFGKFIREVTVPFYIIDKSSVSTKMFLGMLEIKIDKNCGKKMNFKVDL